VDFQDERTLWEFTAQTNLQAAASQQVLTTAQALTHEAVEARAQREAVHFKKTVADLRKGEGVHVTRRVAASMPELVFSPDQKMGQVSWPNLMAYTFQRNCTIYELIRQKVVTRFEDLLLLKTQALLEYGDRVYQRGPEKGVADLVEKLMDLAPCIVLSALRRHPSLAHLPPPSASALFDQLLQGSSCVVTRSQSRELFTNKYLRACLHPGVQFVVAEHELMKQRLENEKVVRPWFNQPYENKAELTLLNRTSDPTTVYASVRKFIKELVQEITQRNLAEADTKLIMDPVRHQLTRNPMKRQLTNNNKSKDHGLGAHVWRNRQALFYERAARAMVNVALRHAYVETSRMFYEEGLSSLDHPDPNPTPLRDQARTKFMAFFMAKFKLLSKDLKLAREKYNYTRPPEHEEEHIHWTKEYITDQYPAQILRPGEPGYNAVLKSPKGTSGRLTQIHPDTHAWLCARFDALFPQ
jgi:hypothetical protein